MSVSIILLSSATDRFLHSRRDSFSTVSSSVAAEMIRQNELNLMRNNIRVGRNQMLHIGDVYNNIFRPMSRTNSDNVQIKEPDKDKDLGTFQKKKCLIVPLIMLITLGIAAWAVYYMVWLKWETSIKLVPRENWFRAESKNLTWPIKRIIVGHTANASCYGEVECMLQVLQIHKNHQHLSDIPYNFLIGGDGAIYEGRGFRYEGEHTSNPFGSSFNDIGVGVAFIGTFETDQPTNEQIDAFDEFIKHFVKEGMIVTDHKIFFRDQLAKPIIPADALLEVLRQFQKFHSIQRIFRRDEWEALPSIEFYGKKFEAPISRLMIWDSDSDVNGTCQSEEECKPLMRLMQSNHFEEHFGDIAYHYIIGGNGSVFEGRGFDVIGTHTHGHNLDSIGISFIGDFQEVPPNNATIDAALRFFEDAVALGKITEDFQINAVMDIRDSHVPGEAFMRIIRTWPRYKKYSIN